MYYEDLVKLRLALFLQYKLYKREPDRYKKEILDVVKKIALINNKLNSGYISCRSHACSKDFREYKKKFKHEFLMQVYHGYRLEDIINYIDFLMVNPGVNPFNYVTSLKNAGYITGDTKDMNAKLELTSKALRYIENEANISLKR